MKIPNRLNQFSKNGRKLLSLFVTAGYPTIESTVPLAVSLANAGADIIELGIPFSDPIADGPTIQFSSEVALRNGVTIEVVFDMARRIRKETSTPIVLMGYTNPVYSCGMDQFFKHCRSAGVDGTIIADLPLEESNEYRELAASNGIASIFLASPTTPNERLLLLDAASTGFLYCVSITGVTGNRLSPSPAVDDFLTRVRRFVQNNPLFAGFGISTPEDVKRISRFCDGVVIGSALVEVLRESPSDRLLENAEYFTRSVRRSLDSQD